MRRYSHAANLVFVFHLALLDFLLFFFFMLMLLLFFAILLYGYFLMSAERLKPSGFTVHALVDHAVLRDRVVAFLRPFMDSDEKPNVEVNSD